MSAFGELLRQYRQECRDPQNGKPLTQARLAEHLCRVCDMEGYSGATISNWERGKNQIRRDDRRVLVGLIQALHETGGLHTPADADHLLLAGNYRPLDSAERQQVNPTWKHMPDRNEAMVFPSMEEQIAWLPPATYTSLIGVETQVAKILDLLSTEKAPYLVVLVGLGGLGKTAVATAVAQAAIRRRTFAQVIWLTAELAPVTPSSDADSFMTLLSMLGEQLMLDRSPETNPQKLLTRVRSKLSRHRYLIVVDNLEDREQTKRLISRLQGLGNPSKFLLTARHYPTPDSDTFAFQLPELTQEDALTLFRQQAKISGIHELEQIPAETFAGIYRVVGGHPLALRLIPQLARRYPLAQVIADWRDRGPGYIEQVYASIYAALWQELTPAEKRLLAVMLSVAQVGATTEQMSFVSDLPRREFWPALTRLVELCLLEPRETTEQRRYGAHSLTINFLQTDEDAVLAEFNAGTLAPLHVAYWRHYLEKLPPRQGQQLDIERHNIFRAVQDSLTSAADEDARELEADWLALADQMVRFVERRGYGHEWLPILKALEEKFVADHTSHGRFLLRLGDIYRLTHQFTQAVETHQLAKEIAIKTANTEMEARAHYSLGVDYFRTREYESGAQAAHAALTMFTARQQVGRETAAAINLLGTLAYAQKQFDLSENYLQQAAVIWQEENAPLELARTLNNLARTQQRLKKPDEAFACYQKARRALAGTASKLDQTLILLSEGTLYFDLGRYQEAEAVFKRIDLSYLRETRHLRYQALAQNNLGNVALVQGNLSTAETCLRQCLELWRTQDDDIEAADTLRLLADVAAAANDRETAVSLNEEALSLLSHYAGHIDADHLREEIAQRLALWRDNG